jgi:hypothetical protein
MPPSWKVDKHYINCQTFGTLFGDYNFHLPTFLTSSYVYLTQSNVWRLQVAHQLMVYPKKTITASFMCKEELCGGGGVRALRSHVCTRQWDMREGRHSPRGGPWSLVTWSHVNSIQCVRGGFLLMRPLHDMSKTESVMGSPSVRTFHVKNIKFFSTKFGTGVLY